MLKERFDDMFSRLYKKSRNHSKMKDCGYTTPHVDDRKVLTELDIAYSASYDNWFIKTFWDGRKAYRYNIKFNHLNEWRDFQIELSDIENDELFLE